MASLFTYIELSAPLDLHMHKTSEVNLSFFQKSIAGNPWTVQATFGLPAVHAYTQRFYDLIHAAQTPKLHQPSPTYGVPSTAPVNFQSSAWNRGASSPDFGGIIWTESGQGKLGPLKDASTDQAEALFNEQPSR